MGCTLQARAQALDEKNIEQAALSFNFILFLFSFILRDSPRGQDITPFFLSPDEGFRSILRNQYSIPPIRGERNPHY